MTDLSPAAQAVYDAVLEICPAPADEIAAAALRAAADQVVPEETWLEPYGEPVNVQRASARRHLNTALVARQEVRRKLLAIAAELESADG
jgi:hypothetical protein